MGRIVVGVDGSDESLRALEWAIDEARMRGGEVLAVHAWQYPMAVGTIEGVVAPSLDIDFRGEAQAIVDRMVKEAAGGGEPPVPVSTDIPQKPAGAALISASKGAELLVVGSRGRGGFSGLLLGSVGQQCAQHARCPVVIIPHDERHRV